MTKCEKDLETYKRLAKQVMHPIPPLDSELWFLDDSTAQAGQVDYHYTLQDIWAAQLVHKSNVPKHHDVGSRLEGFITHCLCFTSVVMLDIRPSSLRLDNLEFIQTDATTLTGIPDQSIQSLSCLHAAEHFGLGRYGDPICPDGHVRLMKSLQRVLAKNGFLYFSVPVGFEKTVFNALRIFNPKTIVDTFNELTILDFKVNNSGIKSFPHWSQYSLREQDCGLFLFTRK